MESEDDFNETFGKKLRKLRDIHGMTQMDLAFKLGYESTGMISQVENGLKRMSLNRIRECSEIFGVPISELLGGKEYSMEEMALLNKMIAILSSPEGNRHKHYDAIKLLLESAA
jgi:transcriptional regulator with XRE-family HTH domain